MADTYDSNKCPKCGQGYSYDEGQVIVLTDEQRSILRDAFRGDQKQTNSSRA